MVLILRQCHAIHRIYVLNKPLLHEQRAFFETVIEMVNDEKKNKQQNQRKNELKMSKNIYYPLKNNTMCCVGKRAIMDFKTHVYIQRKTILQCKSKFIAIFSNVRVVVLFFLHIAILRHSL